MNYVLTTSGACFLFCFKSIITKVFVVSKADGKEFFTGDCWDVTKLTYNIRFFKKLSYLLENIQFCLHFSENIE